MKVRVCVYAELDPLIQKWVKLTGSALFTQHSDGQPARYFHLPGFPPFECFQIVVFPPKQGKVVVQAASIDTNDDAEMLKLWDGPTETLDNLLRQAVATIEQWKVRVQKPRNHS